MSGGMGPVATLPFVILLLAIATLVKSFYSSLEIERMTTTTAQSNNGTVIVTGSSGFIGSAIIRKLAGRYALVGFDRAMARQPPPAAECVSLDLTSERAVAAGLDRIRTAYGERIASVIHLAAYFDLTGQPNPLYDRITVQGTQKLLHALQSFEVEQFVFASTMLVHAPTTPGQLINEASPLDPKFPYRESKTRAERLIHEQRGSIPAVSATLGSIPMISAMLPISPSGLPASTSVN